MGFFNRRNRQELEQPVVEEKKKVDHYVKYGIEYLRKNLDTYIKQEVNRTSDLEEIQERSNMTLEKMDDLDEVIEVVRQNYRDFNEYAEQISEDVVDTDATIEQSSRSVIQLSNQIEDSKKQLTNIVDTFDKLEEDFGQISEFSQGIAGISFQTNLLALNAAIEAARAGEAGRGFSVVASHIQELSSSTNELVNGINASIKTLQDTLVTMQKEITRTSEMMQENIEYSGTVQKSIVQVNTSSDKVKDTIGNMRHTLGETASTMGKAMSGISKSRDAVRQIDEAITDINKKDTEKAILLGQIDNVLNQFDLIAHE